MERLRMSDLRAGERAVVVSLRTPEPMRRRLQDLGLTEGSMVSCLGRSPWGDPTRYRICGAAIALRRADSATIEVRHG